MTLCLSVEDANEVIACARRLLDLHLQAFSTHDRCSPMRLLCGPLPPSRDADVATSRVAGPRLRALLVGAGALALLCVPAPAAAWPEDGSVAELWPYIGLLIALIGIALLAWLLWVRAEVRSLEGPAFLVLRRDRADRLNIRGAEPEPEARLGSGPADALYVAVQQELGAATPQIDPAAPGVAPLGGAGDVVVFAAGGAAAGEAAAPPGAALQFLPGRLEFMGEPGTPDIHFVRQPGPATVITLGRGRGSPERHVQLARATVSRRHAQLRYAAGRWTVCNLSGTNPLRVNGRSLTPDVETCVLVDGDRLELGEVAFIFREK